MGTTDFDIAIVGGGPVGGALALLLATRHAEPSRILVLDRQPLEQSQADPRVLALSDGSMQILQRIADLRALQAAQITTIHVSQAGYLGRAVMRASEERVPALGQVVRYGELMRVLGRALAASGVCMRRPVTVRDIAPAADAVHWADDTGPGSAALLAHAEGGLFSTTDRAQPDDARRHDYAQTGLICEIACTRPVEGCAFERFAAHGPIALLPLPEAGRYALVWCEHPEIAEQIRTLDDSAFLARLQATFGDRLGRFTAATPRHSYPLGLVRRRDESAPRIVRIGNAAQTLHPVGGQGLNLGLRDVFALAQCCADEGFAPAAVMRMRAERRADRAITIGITDAFARTFARDFAPLRHLAGLGLIALDTFAPARAMLARQMMFGVRD